MLFSVFQNLAYTYTILDILSQLIVLHNFCQPKSNPDLDEEDIEKQIARDQEEQNNISFPDPNYSRNIYEEQHIRNMLTHYIQQNQPDGY